MPTFPVFTESWEECSVAELVAGDVVTHILNPGDREWIKLVQRNDLPSAGYLVDHEDDTHVVGYCLYEDGSRPPMLENLFSLGAGCACRVIPWDGEKPEPSDPGKWNDKCPLCSKSIYVGFNASRTNPSEHDGPCR